MKNEAMLFNGFGVSLYIPGDTLKLWKNSRQINNKDHEKFGVLIGTSSESLDEYWVDSVTSPFPKDKSSKFSFMLRDKKHQRIVDKAFAQSGDTTVYLGTWHTHPENIPTPSSTDTNDWSACIRKNPGRQLFFVIVGTKCIRVFVQNGFGFKKLKQKDE